jgi:hypothetical protein
MWTYHQLSGLIEHDCEEVDYGWSGFEDGINVPGMQDIAGIGPLPRGLYIMADPPIDHPELGQYALRLTPAVGTELFGRSEFWWHGRSLKKVFDSSKGCLVSCFATRKQAWESGDHELRSVV